MEFPIYAPSKTGEYKPLGWPEGPPGYAYLPMAQPSGLDTWANTGQEMMLVRNNKGSQITVTFDSMRPVPDGDADELDVEPREIDVPDGEEYLLGPFPPGIYNDAATNTILVTIAGAPHVGVGIAVFRKRL